MKNIDPTKLSLDQLKALAYDESRKLELARQNIATLNNMILQKEQNPGRKAGKRAKT